MVFLYIKVLGNSRTLLTIDQHSCCVEQDPTVYPKLCVCLRERERDGSLWPSCDSGLTYFTGCGACRNSQFANLAYTKVKRYAALLVQRDKNR